MRGRYDDARRDQRSRAALGAVVEQANVGVCRIGRTADDRTGLGGECKACQDGRSEGEEGPHARRIGRFAATINPTYGGDQVSTWSILRQSCKPRSPVGLVNPPANKASAKNDLALAA